MAEPGGLAPLAVTTRSVFEADPARLSGSDSMAERVRVELNPVGPHTFQVWASDLLASRSMEESTVIETDPVGPTA